MFKNIKLKLDEFREKDISGRMYFKTKALHF